MRSDRNSSRNLERRKNTTAQKPSDLLFVLRNPRNLCYLNAAFQLLWNSDAFHDVLIRQTSQSPLTQVLLRSVALVSRKPTDSPPVLETLRRALSRRNSRFISGAQNDAAEAVLTLLAELEETQKAGTNVVKKQLRGSLVVQHTCSVCRHVFVVRERFYVLSIGPSSSLECALTTLTALETVHGYECEQCRRVSVLEKTACFARLPQQLLLQRALSSDRQRTHFAQTLRVNTDEFVLKAVVVHSGSPTDGHYFCFVLKRGSWYRVNDEHIKKVTWDKVRTSCFFLLLFEKHP